MLSLVEVAAAAAAVAVAAAVAEAAVVLATVTVRVVAVAPPQLMYEKVYRVRRQASIMSISRFCGLGKWARSKGHKFPVSRGPNREVLREAIGQGSGFKGRFQVWKIW